MKPTVIFRHDENNEFIPLGIQVNSTTLYPLRKTQKLNVEAPKWEWQNISSQNLLEGIGKVIGSQKSTKKKLHFAKTICSSKKNNLILLLRIVGYEALFITNEEGSFVSEKCRNKIKIFPYGVEAVAFLEKGGIKEKIEVIITSCLSEEVANSKATLLKLFGFLELEVKHKEKQGYLGYYLQQILSEEEFFDKLFLLEAALKHQLLQNVYFMPGDPTKGRHPVVSKAYLNGKNLVVLPDVQAWSRIGIELKSLAGMQLPVQLELKTTTAGEILLASPIERFAEAYATAIAIAIAIG